MHKGKKVFNTGDIERAYRYFIVAKKQNPINGKVASALGVVNLKRFIITRDVKFLNEAEAYLKGSVRMMPLAPENFQMLGRLYEIKGYNEKAKEFYDRYVELAPYKHI